MNPIFIMIMLFISLLFSVFILFRKSLSPFKCKSLPLEDEFRYRISKGGKLCLLFTLSPINIFILFLSNDAYSYLYSISIMMLLTGLGYIMPPKLTVLNIKELIVSPNLTSKTINIHLNNFDDSFSRTSYRRLNEVLIDIKDKEYDSIEMTSPMFSKGDQIRDFKLLESLLAKNDLKMEFRLVNRYELLFTRLSFSIIKFICRTESLNNTGKLWIKIVITKLKKE